MQTKKCKKQQLKSTVEQRENACLELRWFQPSNLPTEQVLRQYSTTTKKKIQIWNVLSNQKKLSNRITRDENENTTLYIGYHYNIVTI